MFVSFQPAGGLGDGVGAGTTWLNILVFAQRVGVVAVVLEGEVGQAVPVVVVKSKFSRMSGIASLTIVTLPQLLRSIGNGAEPRP